MLAQERHKLIMDYLSKNRIITISDMIKIFKISKMTARRDLDMLEEKKLINRVYGGAVKAETYQQLNPTENTIFNQDTLPNIKRIGALASTLINDGETIFMESGRTVLEVAKNMHDFTNLTILTNSFAVANELVATSNTIYVLGGLLDKTRRSFNDNLASEMLSKFCADKAFLSCDGVSLEHGICDKSTATSELSKIMIQNSNQAILVADSSKFKKSIFSIVAPLERIHTIVTDDELLEKTQREITKQGINLLIASNTEDNDILPS